MKNLLTVTWFLFFLFSSQVIYGQIIRIQPINSRVCETSSSIILRATPEGGVWTSNDIGAIQNGNEFSPSDVVAQNLTIWLYYTYTDPVSSTVSTDSIFSQVDAQASIEIQGEDSFCYSNVGQSLRKAFNITTENSHSVDLFLTNYYGNNDKMSSKSLSNGVGEVTFSPTRDRDTFRIGLIAGGLGSCADVSSFFDVQFMQDPSCLNNATTPKDSEISIYPNPSAGEFTINHLTSYDLKLFNELGQEVDFNIQKDNSILISQRGMYFLELINKSSSSRSHKTLLVK